MSSVAELMQQVVDSTPVSFETGTKQFINDAVSRNHLFSELMRNKTDKETIRTGPSIKDRILLSTNGGLEAYTPGEEVNIEFLESHTNHTSHWAHYFNPISWTEADEELNINAGSMTAKGVHSHLKDVLAQKEQVAYSNAIEGLDALFLATPNAGTMEHTSTSNDKAQVRCLGSFINEFSNGLITGMGNTGGDFTSIQGISGEANWAPQQLTYSLGNYADRSHATNLIKQLLLMHRRVKFVRPLMPFPGATEQTSMSDTQFILTGEEGYTQMEDAYGQNGDNFVTPNPRDPSFGTMTVNGSRIVEVAALDQALWYSDGTNLVAQADATLPGARYMFIDSKYLTVKMHGKKFFERRKTRELPNTIGGYWAPMVTWTQLWIDSLRRHGIVSPIV